MKRILRHVGLNDPEAVGWLKTIDSFDQLVADEAGLDRLARTAARLSRRSVGIDDTWNGRRVWMPVGHGRTAAEDEAAAEASRSIINAVVAQRLRGRRSAIVRDDAMEACVASVEVASGRVGTVWLLRDGRPWETVDHVITERLAAAVAADALRVRSRSARAVAGEPVELQRLLRGGATADEVADLARRAQLTRFRSLVAVAAEDRPIASASPDALVQIAVRALRARGIAARGAIIGRTAALVVDESPSLDDAFRDLQAGQADLGFAIEFGVGEAGGPDHLSRSWQQAREALALASVASGGRNVAYYRQLGILHLLAHIPRDLLVESQDFKAVARLGDADEVPSDLELLERYCDTGSLRKTATEVYLHHTSVDRRLKKIEAELGISLAKPADRLAAHVAVKLVRIERGRRH